MVCSEPLSWNWKTSEHVKITGLDKCYSQVAAASHAIWTMERPRPRGLGLFEVFFVGGRQMKYKKWMICQTHEIFNELIFLHNIFSPSALRQKNGKFQQFQAMTSWTHRFHAKTHRWCSISTGHGPKLGRCNAMPRWRNGKGPHKGQKLSQDCDPWSLESRNFLNVILNLSFQYQGKIQFFHNTIKRTSRITCASFSCRFMFLSQHQNLSHPITQDTHKRVEKYNVP